jgi:hypothetical protein
LQKLEPLLPKLFYISDPEYFDKMISGMKPETFYTTIQVYSNLNITDEGFLKTVINKVDRVMDSELSNPLSVSQQNDGRHFEL